ncbi:Histidine kinase [Candidatus Sulfopaludibacter sp. SbA3]|nr:Histidine kinase [Candidatus Sulfopaludibacter sp. SbA3]
MDRRAGVARRKALRDSKRPDPVLWKRRPFRLVGEVAARVPRLSLGRDGDRVVAMDTGPDPDLPGLWRWTPDPTRIYPISDPLERMRDLIEGDNGALWIATERGLRQLINGKPEPCPLPGGGQVNPIRLFRDREGSPWIGTRQGLLHVHQGKTDRFASSDGLSGDTVQRIFEDRESNIWVATSEGLDRFRDLAVSTMSVKQGLSGIGVGSVLAASDGSVWMETGDGLNRWNNGQITVYRNRSVRTLGPAQWPSVREITDSGLPDNSQESLLQDQQGRIWVATARGLAYFEDGRFVSAGRVPATLVHSMVDDRAGGIWINDQAQGLMHWVDGKVVESIAWAKLDHRDHASALAADPATGGLWVGFTRGGIVYFREGRVQARYASGLVNELRFGSDGALWAATEAGFAWLKNGRLATLTHENGLPCDAVHWAMDNAESVWMGTACGLVRIPRSELASWAADPKRTIQAAVFDASDGVKDQDGAGGYSPHAAKSQDGRLWFVTGNGVAVVDPRRIPFNKLPPPVSIERITANGAPFPAAAGPLRLPKLIRDLQIDYTGLSFVAPEKNRFRYELEGHDTEWQDAGNRRQAFYSDLPPRKYRFRVIACNNSGVWNEAGAAFDFSIAPAYYQTTWFLAVSIAASLALLASLYRLRLRYVKHQFNMRLEERVAERTRIARDFHDTLLQSFQGVLMKFSTVAYTIKDPPEARETLEKVIEQARQAVTEGRDAVQALRTSTVVTNDLVRAITTLGEQLATEYPGASCPELRVQAQGASRELAPIVRDEVYRIASEAVRNAYRHAQAGRINVEILYGGQHFRLRVLDNGRGIDQKVLAEGGRIGGHHGLSGMQERANLAGGKLVLSSKPGSGAEAELTIPAAFAYVKPAAGRRSMSSGKGTS